MIPEEYLGEQQARIRQLMDFVDQAEEDIFSMEKMKTLSLEKQYERYLLAKETLNKEIDNNLKIMKSDENLPPDTKALMGIILSLNSEELKKLKSVILDLKNEK